ncbi:MAG: hypothetical protein WAQ27_05325 [Candidatus Microsaccharimonas sp.]
MDTIGVFNFTGATVAIIVIAAAVTLVIATVLYIAANLLESGFALVSAVVVQVISFGLTFTALMSWWTNVSWSTEVDQTGVVIGSAVLIIIAIVVPPAVGLNIDE